jgi:hypothetical protein
MGGWGGVCVCMGVNGSMLVCVHARVCVHACMLMCVGERLYERACVWVCVWALSCVCACMCVRACMYVCAGMHAHVCLWVCACVYVHSWERARLCIDLRPCMYTYLAWGLVTLCSILYYKHTNITPRGCIQNTTCLVAHIHKHTDAVFKVERLR